MRTEGERGTCHWGLSFAQSQNATSCPTPISGGLWNAKSIGRQSQERLQAAGAELPGEHVASFRNLAVVCTIATGGGDHLHPVLGDRGRLPLIRVGGAAGEIYEGGGPVGQFGGVQDGEHRGEVVLVDVADAVCLAENVLEFGIVLAVGDDSGG